MVGQFELSAKELYEEGYSLIDMKDPKASVPKVYKDKFFSLIDKINFSLIEDKENFYGYFILQMERDIRFDITYPTGINFQGNKYVIYFNPLLFLQLNMKQMESTIKHEIYHILMRHLIRAKDLKGKYSTLAVNLAMDLVVNQYLNYLPPYAVTLGYLNNKYNLELLPYNTFEYYAGNIQNLLDLEDEDEEGEVDDTKESSDLRSEANLEKAHDIWEESIELDEKTIKEFTEKFVNNAQKGTTPTAIQGIIDELKNSKEELPWNLYLKRLVGLAESNKKKTVTRRSRRQPDRLDLRGELRNHKAKIAVAIDISGSISDEEFKQAMKEVISIVKSYNYEITVIECDNSIKNVYEVKNVKDLKERTKAGGGTSFEPVFKYLNSKDINLLIYFTDGKGEEKLQSMPRGYKVMWVISGSGDKLSLKEPYGVVKKLKKVKIDDALDLKDLKHDGYSMNAQEPIF